MWFRKEKRKFPRIKGHHLLKYSISGGEKVLSFVKDISVGGVLFHCREELASGTALELELRLTVYQTPLKLSARVVRVRPLKGMEGFEVGAEFVGVDRGTRELIKRNL